MRIGLVWSIVVLTFGLQAQTVQVGLLKYGGGGDWYANPTSLPNLIEFCNEQLHAAIQAEPLTVDVGSTDLFDCPFVHMTGHGNVLFNAQEAANLRAYLEAGGFLHIDDNYGLDPFIRREMKKVFPEQDFVELPFDHPIYRAEFMFQEGLPKIHEHDMKAPKGYGITLNGRLVCFYSYECDLGDGWEDEDVHNDPLEIRLKALQMGANIMSYAFNH